jgi:hypothetical protein
VLSPGIIVMLAAGGVSDDALPGVRRLRIPEPLPWWIAASVSTGYAFTESVLGTGDAHHRLVGKAALAVQALQWLAFTLELDMRYDRHAGVDPPGDDSTVGEPSLGAHWMLPVGDGFRIGLSADVHFSYRGPGFDPIPAGISPSFRASASHRFASPDVTLGLSVGYTYDQTSKAAPDPSALSAADRLVLGASAFDRIPIAAGAVWRFGSFAVVGELGLEPLIGSGAPRASLWPFDVSAGARYRPGDAWIEAQLLLVVALSSRPEVDLGTVPIEPRVAILASVSFVPSFDEAAPPPKPIPIVEPAPGIHGRVVAVSGAGIEGAVLSLSRGEVQVDTATSAAGGTFDLEPALPGAHRLSIEAPGYVVKEVALQVVPGIVEITIQLAPDLPEGELRGTVSSGGRPVEAILEVAPVGFVVRTGRDGAFAIEIPPGSYDVTIRASGYEAQKRAITIESNGVTYLNADLRRRSGSEGP